MNDHHTAAALLDSATQLFAENGFAATSVRAITARAGANLGAVTYHFGNKEGLYTAVLERATTPFRQRIAAAAAVPGTALDRIESVVRAFFAHLLEHPELRRLLLQQLASGRPVPEPARNTIRANFGVVGGLIREGQRDGSVREGDPLLLALSVGSQPAVLNFVAPALREGLGVDLEDPDIYQRLVANAVRFVRAGLQQSREGEG